jgi:hypothetical protein
VSNDDYVDSDENDEHFEGGRDYALFNSGCDDDVLEYYETFTGFDAPEPDSDDSMSAPGSEPESEPEIVVEGFDDLEAKYDFYEAVEGFENGEELYEGFENGEHIEEGFRGSRQNNPCDARTKTTWPNAKKTCADWSDDDVASRQRGIVPPGKEVYPGQVCWDSGNQKCVSEADAPPAGSFTNNCIPYNGVRLNDKDCTKCQGYSDEYGIITGGSFGTAPKTVQDDWISRSCNTKPINRKPIVETELWNYRDPSAVVTWPNNLLCKGVIKPFENQRGWNGLLVQGDVKQVLACWAKNVIDADAFYFAYVRGSIIRGAPISKYDPKARGLSRTTK